jgi:cell division protein FtsL
VWRLKYNLEMKEFWQSLNKFYFANLLLVASVIFSIIFTFLVQFRVEGLQDDMVKTENEIIAYEDEIQLLEVEWVYLTRPERLRTLASRYLQDNGYALASQIKDVDKLEQYYLVNYQKAEEKLLASNEQDLESQQVSF